MYPLRFLSVMYMLSRHFEGHVHCTMRLDSKVFWYDQMLYISGNADQYVVGCFNERYNPNSRSLTFLMKL